MRKGFLFFLLLSFGLRANPSDYCPQPSWCRDGDYRGMSAGEITVCSDEILSIEDNLMAAIYRKFGFMESERELKELQTEQRAWLRERNRISDRDRMMLFYLDRIRALAVRLAADRTRFESCR